MILIKTCLKNTTDITGIFIVGTNIQLLPCPVHMAITVFWGVIICYHRGVAAPVHPPPPRYAGARLWAVK